MKLNLPKQITNSIDTLLTSICDMETVEYVFPDNVDDVTLSEDEVLAIKQLAADVDNITDYGFAGEGNDYI